jgi:hypothetical protein
MNQYQWNLRYPDASTFQGMLLWQGQTQGPIAAPGTYTVRITAGGNAPMTQTFTVKHDPRLKVTDADLVEQHRFAMQVRDRVTAANDAIRTIRNLKRQLDDRAAKMSGAPAFAGLARTFADSLSAVADSIYQTKNKSGEDPLNFPIRINNQMAALLGFVENGERRPPKQAYDVFAVLNPQLERELTRYKRIVDAGLRSVNPALKAAGQQEIVPSTAEPPAAAGGGRQA